MRMKYKRRGRRFTVYEADTPPTLLPCLQSRQPSLNSVDIDSGCSSNNKAGDVAFAVRGGGGVFHAMGTAASRTEKHKRLDLPLRCSLLVTRDQMSAAIEIQRATSSIVTAIELLRTTLSTCPMRERKKLGQSWFNRPMIDPFPSNFVEKTLKISPKFPS